MPWVPWVPWEPSGPLATDTLWNTLGTTRWVRWVLNKTQVCDLRWNNAFLAYRCMGGWRVLWYRVVCRHGTANARLNASPSAAWAPRTPLRYYTTANLKQRRVDLFP